MRCLKCEEELQNSPNRSFSLAENGFCGLCKEVEE